MDISMYDQSTFLILKAAYAYYIDGKAQSEIAQDLGISVTTVSRLLKKAKDDHIIEFVIRDSYIECLRLGKELKEQFNLKDVIIAPTGNLSDVQTPGEKSYAQRMVALEAARYIQRIIKKDDVLGVTWGSTVYEMINYLNPAQKIDATFVTLHGSLASCIDEWDVRTLVMRLAKAFSGKNYMLLSGALMSSEKLASLQKQERDMAYIYNLYKRVNIAINGIGSFYPELDSILALPTFLPEENLQELLDEGVVGDIALRFFNKNGKECNTSLKNRTISIEFNQFKKIPLKITLASGIQKAHTVFYALKGHLIDVLIVDEMLAKKILEIGEEMQKDKPGQ